MASRSEQSGCLRATQTLGGRRHAGRSQSPAASTDSRFCAGQKILTEHEPNSGELSEFWPISGQLLTEMMASLNQRRRRHNRHRVQRHHNRTCEGAREQSVRLKPVLFPGQIKIHIKKAVFFNSQGLSIINAQDLLVQDSEFSFTNGTVQ